MAVRLFSGMLVCFTTMCCFRGLCDAHPQESQVKTLIDPISEHCLGCICEAISSCDLSLTCTGDVCGPYRITWAYWYDSGSPVLQGDNPKVKQAYQRCTNDPTCAKLSTKKYLTRFSQDCNGDGIIDCFDFSAIHKLGGYSCSNPLDIMYKNKFNSCMLKNNQPDINPDYSIFPSINETSSQTETTEAELDLRIPNI